MIRTIITLSQLGDIRSCEQVTQEYYARVEYLPYTNRFLLRINERYSPVLVLEKESSNLVEIMDTASTYGMIDGWHVNTITSEQNLLASKWVLDSHDYEQEYGPDHKHFAYSTLSYAFFTNGDYIAKIDVIYDHDETSPNNEIYVVSYAHKDDFDESIGHSEYNWGTLEFDIDNFDLVYTESLGSYATVNECLNAIGIPESSDILQHDRLVPHLWHGYDESYALDIARQHVLNSLTIEKYRAFLIACYADSTVMHSCAFKTFKEPLETYLYALTGSTWEVSANCWRLLWVGDSVETPDWLVAQLRNSAQLAPINRELPFMTPTMSELLATFE